MEVVPGEVVLIGRSEKHMCGDANLSGVSLFEAVHRPGPVAAESGGFQIPAKTRSPDQHALFARLFGSTAHESPKLRDRILLCRYGTLYL